MSPRKEIINGPRPSPLKINKDSHFINKPSAAAKHQNQHQQQQQQQQQQRHPVIIYTHSPKIIHTQARDFMALVQKLTGLSSSSSDTTTVQINNAPVRPSSRDDNESSSVLTDEHYGGDGQVISSSSVSPMMLNANNSHPYQLADIPLFTPNSTDFFFSPRRPLYRFPDPAFASPTMTNSISPSLLDFMKELPEY